MILFFLTIMIYILFDFIMFLEVGQRNIFLGNKHRSYKLNLSVQYFQ